MGLVAYEVVVLAILAFFLHLPDLGWQRLTRVSAHYWPRYLRYSRSVSSTPGWLGSGQERPVRTLRARKRELRCTGRTLHSSLFLFHDRILGRLLRQLAFALILVYLFMTCKGTF